MITDTKLESMDEIQIRDLYEEFFAYTSYKMLPELETIYEQPVKMQQEY